MKKKQWLVVILTILMAAGFLSPLAAEEDEGSSAYDRMVEEATREADAYWEDKARQRSGEAKDDQPLMDPALAERVKTERERIETEMDKVRQRGLGPNFTVGMKENRLEELQDTLNRLLSDPQAYFSE